MTRSFEKQASKIWSEEELQEIVTELSLDPEIGVLIMGAKGMRKARFSAKGRGKSGGGRVIYFFYSAGYPLVLAAALDKSHRENLGRYELQVLAGLAEQLKESFRSKL